MKTNRGLLWVGVCSLLVGCDYLGADFYGEVTETAPGVLHLGELVPVEVSNPEEVQSAPVYAELGITGNVSMGGATFSFVGTGDSVCVWVDPESVHWNQSVHATSPQTQFAYPDNMYDDGDIDLYAGFSVYYNGSPGETIGDFQVRYDDSLGNTIPVEFNECKITDLFGEPNGHAGRATPEYCTLTSTSVGVRYMVLLEQFSTPLDDNLLGFGVMVTEGTCQDLKNAAGGQEECVIRGESIKPSEHDYRDEPIRAYGQQQAEEVAWPNSVGFEGLYCDALTGNPDSKDAMYEYCVEEAANNDCGSDGVRCFCGDTSDTPTGGSF